MGMMMPTSSDFANQIRKQDAAHKAFADAICEFLHEAFPRVQLCTLDNLANRYVDLLCCGSEEQIAALEKAHYPSPFQPSVESITYLIQERDRLQEQIDEQEAAAQRMEESMPVEGMGDVIRSTMITPIKQRLREVEERISNQQAELEKVQEPAP